MERARRSAASGTDQLVPLPDFPDIAGDSGVDGAADASSPKAAQVHTTTLLLRLTASADFFTTNATLMSHPLPVRADVILDPYIGLARLTGGGAVPQSLVYGSAGKGWFGTAAYVLMVGGVGIMVAGRVWWVLMGVVLNAASGVGEEDDGADERKKR